MTPVSTILGLETLKRSLRLTLWYCFYVSSYVTALLYSTKLNVILLSTATVHQPLLTTTTNTSSMTGMALDSIQRTTRTPWTTSLDSKKGSQKSELLDGFSSVTTPNDYPPQMTHTEMTPPVKPPSTFPARPSPNTSSPSEASISGATARLKNWYNRSPVQNRISTRHFFQAYSAPVMTNEQVLTRLNDILLKAKRRERVEFY